MGWRRLVLLVACLGIAVACSRLFRGGGGTVTVAKVRVETTAPQVTVVGQLVASESAEIAFPYEVRIEKVFVNEGDHLLAGDPLVSLSQAEAQARLAQLRAARKEAEALLERNAFIFKNRDRLLEEGKLDQSQYAGVESEVRVGEAAVERAKADIAALEQQAAAGTVASPIAGIVQKRLTHPGAVVGASQPIIVVTRIDP
ncbi:MAG: biotin/lipoyl-binding protein, partial [Deltaproteobacteria bacterium]|nr:biotin/lipoyl-binding protein [Deltaproteobacteria bacterium]